MALYGPKTPGCSQPLPQAWKNVGPQHSSHTLWELTTLIFNKSHDKLQQRVHGYWLVKAFVRAVLKRWEMWDKQNVCQTTKKEKRKKNNHTSLYGHLVRAIFVWPRQGTRKQNGNNKRTEIERFDWFIERIQTRVAFGWLSERSGEKTSCPRTF